MSTPFQEAVYNALRLIPKGRVTTYSAIAGYLKTKAIRAVGTAVAKNPNAPETPCHRVVPSTGKLGNYSGDGGVEMKRRLLMEEGVLLDNDIILDFANIVYDFSDQPL